MADSVRYRETKEFQEWQNNQQFLGWLKMSDGLMQIEFPLEVPEVAEIMYTKESLPIVERKAVELYPGDWRDAVAPENIGLTMQFVYYIGETFRRNFEGEWVVLPPSKHRAQPQSAVDLPFNLLFTEPLALFRVSLIRRTGNEISTVYKFAEESYQGWVNDGRPDRRD